MKFNLILLLFLFNYSLSQIVFPFKVRENYEERYSPPINETKFKIDKYLYHILNEFEFTSEVEVGLPKQKVEVTFNSWDNYLGILMHSPSLNPYFYNKSTTYKEIKEKDPDCSLQVYNPFTINEILHLKNKFYDNLDDFILSKDEQAHEFVIIFSKVLPKINYQNTGYKYTSSNSVSIGLLINTNYNRDHGIYNPFLNEIQEKGFINNKTYFFYFFEKYGKKFNYKSIINSTSSPYYNGLIVFGKLPHELLPDIYDINNLSFTDPFFTTYKYSDTNEIEWGVKFDQIYLEYNDNKTDKFNIFRGIFDFNVEYIFPPMQFYDKIKKFFEPLFDDDICFEEENPRQFNKDGFIYRMIYCKYEEFKKDYLETFPKLKFKLKDFDETFEFTYKDLFRPVYNNKYYLFLLFIRRLSGGQDVSSPPTWYLGRMFMNKYQFIFDADNKKVGYYKTPIPEEEEPPEKTDEIKTDETDTTKTDERDTTKTDESDTTKTDESDTTKTDENGSDTVNKTDNVSDEKDKTDNTEPKKNKSVDIVLIIVFSVVSAIIIIAVIIVLYKCIKNKDKRKKRANELIDEDDYSNDAGEANNEEKGIN